ncbi:MAG TPA: type II toxin-antitoxin system HicB family antitoxin [Candidatus Peribacteraceae bacterium]|nr:type II toxin-antitoxin system HicB family antitoxin [Candidatus Peribacteraceae bacterium]
MNVYSAVIERCPQTGLFVGFVPGFPGAHSQGETLDEVNHNLNDVITMLLEDGEPVLESEFVGVQKSQSLESWAIFPSSNTMRLLPFSSSSASPKSASAYHINNFATPQAAAQRFRSI